MNNNNKAHSLSSIETNGVKPIPDHERSAGPGDLFRLIFGGAKRLIGLPATLGLLPEPAAVFGPDDPRSKGTDSLAKPALGQPV
jgi:hypothetical protein